MIPAVGIICFKGDQVLLIRRGTPPKLGQWSLPGGRIQPGETTRETAHRELCEETGVTGNIIALVDIIPATFEQTFSYLLIDYVVHWTHGDARAGDDAMDAKFVPLSELTNYQLWDVTQRVIETAYEQFGSHL